MHRHLLIEKLLMYLCDSIQLRGISSNRVLYVWVGRAAINQMDRVARGSHLSTENRIRIFGRELGVSIAFEGNVCFGYTAV